MKRESIEEYSRKKYQYTELRALILYSIYTVVLLIAGLVLDWDRWFVPVLLMACGVVWGTYLKQYKTYHYRTFLVTIITMFEFAFYGINAGDFMAMIPAMGVLAIMFAIYGVPENMYIMMGCSAAVLLYHIFVTGDVVWRASMLENCRLVAELISAFMIEYLAWHLVNKQVEDEKRLVEIIRRMERAEQSKNDFLANMSHELRTPINTVTGMSELILQRELPEDAREEIFDIQIAGRGLLSIVSDVLEYTELESGNIEIIEEPYNIISTINDVINMALAQNQEKKLELIVDCDATIPSGLMGDEQKIRRVMSNLVGNAIKFTNKGCVTIRISYRKEEYGINLKVCVKDTGIGLEQQEIEKMFYRFYQADAKRSRREEGVGLGLAICDGLVREMGGFLTVHSTPGKGSEFFFTLPQKVLDETPSIVVEHRQDMNVICYFDIEKYSFADTRDDYMNSLYHISETLGVPMYLCRSQTELARKIKGNHYTHLFTTVSEYRREKQFFEELAGKMKVTVIIDRADEIPAESGVGCIYKPFYALSIANVLNGNEEEKAAEVSHNHLKPFVAPEAKVLIVDDNLMNLKVAEGLLLQYKILISTATSGEEALVKINSMDYDFIFMDHMMPGMDGVEALHRIRQKPGRYYQTVPIIALTANAIGGAREMFLQEGFQDFVAKPIDLSVLERVLRRFIPDRKIVPVDEYVSQEEAVPEEQMDIEKEGIHITEALEYFDGDLQAYRDIAEIYCDTGEEKIPQIQLCYEKEDWDEYVVQVHAVKSTSLNIGAVDLSEMAKKLEFHGKEGRISEIRKEHFSMMEEYHRVIDLLRAYCEKNSGSEKERGNRA